MDTLDDFKAKLVQQPLAVVLAANNKYIHSYSSGVIDADECYGGLDSINHAVLIVGYGTDEATGLEYWLIRNSWNSTWGEKGYLKIKTFKPDEYSSFGGICGVQFRASYPILE